MTAAVYGNSWPNKQVIKLSAGDKHALPRPAVAAVSTEATGSQKSKMNITYIWTQHNNGDITNL